MNDTTSESAGRPSTNTDDPKQLLIWWIEERWRVLQQKSTGSPKPWSDDPVFQTTYFCNVRREDDKTTRWIRNRYSPFVADPMFEYNIILSRFLNWPGSLDAIGYCEDHVPDHIIETLNDRISRGLQNWSGAYIITTHGIPMPKVQYLAENVLGGVYRGLERLQSACRGTGLPPTLSHAHTALMGFEGLGSFLAAQVIADLKNTKGHPLEHVADWWMFAAPGPGSMRGLEWFHGRKVPWNVGFFQCREYVDEHLNWHLLPRFCNQDLQNCLCEFDKYMRVRNGTGRSKRNYNGYQN